MDHTPGPWHVGIGNGKGNIFSAAGRMRLEAEGTVLYPVAVMVNFEDEAEANAAYIVKCCNAYDDMLSALKRVEQTVRNLFNGFYVTDRIILINEMRNLQADILKAEGDPNDRGET